MADPLVVRLQAACGADQVFADIADRSQWAADASIYHLIPRVVVIPRTVAEVQAALRIAVEEKTPVCFRAGGTSLSGQAVTDGILIVISRHLRGIQVHPSTESVTCEPGAVGAWVNAALAPHGRRIGPDPASIQAAEIGGIVANNASGMCCGVAENSYHTVTGLDLVLADGWRIDTGATDADQRLEQERPQLASGLRTLAADIRSHPTLPGRIHRAFATKNTVGYSLNAFLDADSPAGILQRLVVGSEGTLAFIASATFRTLPLPKHRATAWLLFRDVEEASRAVAPLTQLHARAIELLDAVALRRIEADLPQALPAGEPAALLVEFQESDEAVLAARIDAAAPVLMGFDLVAPAAFTRDAKLQATYWKIRKGLFPSVGAVRAAGTAVVIEDVTFPVERLAIGVRALRACFEAHGYGDAVIFGHAKDGNLHFTLTPDLSRADEVARYDRFMQAMVDVVLSEGGHLKAEHGTGRNIAPFVERQWGADAVAIMRRIKALLDPNNILNPGVLLSDDPQAHLKHLKTLPAVDASIDRCIECGFCEPVCPSRDVTYSPRQRIAALRAIARGGLDASAVKNEWQHRGLDTCAGDGMCETACPVHIDTGAFVRSERFRSRPGFLGKAAVFASEWFDVIAGTTRLGLRLAAFARIRRLPWSPIPLPPPAAPLPEAWPTAVGESPTLIYFPTCLGRMMGPGSLAQALADCCQAAGVGLVVPENAGNLCCGQPFASKGFPDAATSILRRTALALLATGQQTILVSDTSTCAAQFDQAAHLLDGPARDRWLTLRRLPPAAVMEQILLPRLQANGRLSAGGAAFALHPTCSEHRHGWTGDLLAAAGRLGQAAIPAAAGCCGMAGDKGWSTPELTAGATKREAAEVAQDACGLTTSTTCGYAMEAATGRPYQHLFLAVAARLTPANRPT
jgi:D-lactate dehydrogenase